MVLDSSAIVAIMLSEPTREALLDKIRAGGAIAIGAPTLFESALVLERRFQGNPSPRLGTFVRAIGAEVIPFGEDHYSVAIAAHLRFGKGRHPAALNLGDCLAYATAKIADEPLLYVGSDFPKTDVRTA